MEYDAEQEKILDEGDDEGGWVDTHHFESAIEQKICDMSLEANNDEAPGTSSAPVAADDEEDVALDMEEFEAAGLLDEEDGQTRVEAPPKKDEEAAGGDVGEIVQTRTYDLHITYDKYYQTPRLWLFGYDEVGKHVISLSIRASVCRMSRS